MSSNFQSHDSGLNANGRFGRLSYLGWNMLTFLITIIAAVLFSIICAIVAPNFLSTATINGNLSISLLFIVGIFYIVLIYFSFIFSIRRLHDRNHSGWLSLLILAPFLNLFFILYLIFAPGTPGSNNYGAPHITKTWEKVLGWMYFLIFPLGILAAIAIPAYQNYVDRAQHQQIELHSQHTQSE